MRRICVFTSTRADYGLLQGVIEKIVQSPSLELRLLVSGSHLRKDLGYTIDEIKEVGFDSITTIDIELDDDSPTGICHSMGGALDKYGRALTQIAPDICLVLGDRFETFCFAACAQVMRLPLAHIHGGETTEGAIDEAFRHSITKMSHLHFTACEEYRKRVIQLGENPTHVFNVGALGVENALTTTLMELPELSASIGFELDCPYFLVTFHPVTLESGTAVEQCQALMNALRQFPEYKILFTKSNADTEGNAINAIIEQAETENPQNWKVVASLGMKRYLSAVKHAAAVVGNSSSGIIEVPSFGVPTVNIGDRQKGRVRAKSVIDCNPTTGDITKVIQKATDSTFAAKIKNIENPYAKPGTAKAIVKEIQKVKLDSIMKKSFWNIQFN
jgi:GDP/UDP-N,N'-diacetylbacillosamine 2-epimerase (hydrolysing)